MTHLETYLDVLKILPNEFQREFVLMGELDKKAMMVQHEMESVQASILEAAAKPDGIAPNKGGKSAGQPEPSVEDRLAHLRQLHQMSVDLHNEKLALAKQSRDMVRSMIGSTWVMQCVRDRMCAVQNADWIVVFSRVCCPADRLVLSSIG
jgi:hypothetical protein